MKIRVGNARGEIRAEINGMLEATVQLSEIVSEKMISEKPCGIKISVFGRDITIGKTENVFQSEESYLRAFGIVEIPVTVTRYYDVTEKETTLERSADEARSEAEQRINALVQEVLVGTETVSLKISYIEDENGITARAEYVCIADITEKKNVG